MSTAMASRTGVLLDVVSECAEASVVDDARGIEFRRCDAEVSSYARRPRRPPGTTIGAFGCDVAAGDERP